MSYGSPSLELISGGIESAPEEAAVAFAVQFAQTVEGDHEILLERLLDMKYQYLGAVRECDRDMGDCPPMAWRGEQGYRHCVGAIIDPKEQRLAVVRYCEQESPQSKQAWQVAYYDFNRGRYGTVPVLAANMSDQSVTLDVSNMTSRADRGNMQLQFYVDQAGHTDEMKLTSPKYYGRGVGQLAEEFEVGQYTVAFDGFYEALEMELYGPRGGQQELRGQLGALAAGYQIAS